MDVTRTQLEELIRAIHDVVLIRKDISLAGGRQKLVISGALSVLGNAGDLR